MTASHMKWILDRQASSNFAGGVDIGYIGVDHDFEQHAWMVAGGAAAFILLQERIDVEPVNDPADGAHGRVRVD